MTTKIIDVSKHNGNIDFDKVAKDSQKITGVIIRAGFGKVITQKDIMFENNYAQAKVAGLNVGAYWYSYALTAAEAKQEANVFLEVMKGKQFDLPVYCDIEEPNQVKAGKAVCTSIAKTFCDTLEAAGYFVGVYSFDSFFNTNLDTSIPKRYTTWVARVDGKKPQYCPDHKMWQYSWKGKVNGINGDVDMNECYAGFPTTIIGNGLNGYKKDGGKLYTVSGEKKHMSSSEASTIETALKSMGMTVKKETEV